MQNYKFKHGDIEAWLIAAAIDGEQEVYDRIQRDPEGGYPVLFSVGGVELDFTKVAKRIDESIDTYVLDKAQQLLSDKYGTLSCEVDKMLEKIKEHEDVLFSLKDLKQEKD